MGERTPVTDEDFVALRHRLHAAPELAYEEHGTSALVADCLRLWGFDVETGIGQTGVVGADFVEHEAAGVGLLAAQR